MVAVAVLVHTGVFGGFSCRIVHCSLTVVDTPLTGTGATKLNV
jgi:hypothetical protein